MGKNGQWFRKGHGADPDYEVIADPSKLTQGDDPQMDRAIELLPEDLEKNPPVKMEHPEFQEC